MTMLTYARWFCPFFRCGSSPLLPFPFLYSTIFYSPLPLQRERRRRKEEWKKPETESRTTISLFFRRLSHSSFSASSIGRPFSLPSHWTWWIVYFVSLLPSLKLTVSLILSLTVSPILSLSQVSGRTSSGIAQERASTCDLLPIVAMAGPAKSARIETNWFLWIFLQFEKGGSLCESIPLRKDWITRPSTHPGC